MQKQISILLIPSAKFWSARGASHQPVFMGSCPTISHTCLPFLPSRRTSPCVLCPLMIGLIRNGGSVDFFCMMSMINAILGNGCVIQGQNYVA